MGFFLALLDAKLGFDTAAGASVQRQAEREHAYHQVPLPASLPSAQSCRFVYQAAQPTAEHSDDDEDDDDGSETHGARPPGPRVGGSVYSALARVFTESVEEGKRLTGSAGAPAAYDTTSDGAQDSARPTLSLSSAHKGGATAASAAPSSAADGDGVAPPRPRHAQARSSSFDA